MYNFIFHEILEKANKFIVTESSSYLEIGVGSEMKWRKEGEGVTKGHGHHRCAYYLDCGDDFMGIYISQNLSNCTL